MLVCNGFAEDSTLYKRIIFDAINLNEEIKGRSHFRTTVLDLMFHNNKVDSSVKNIVDCIVSGEQKQMQLET